MTLPPVPKFSIREVLVALGADPHSIPSGYGWKKMACFLHEDRNPSARVNTEVGGYKCFSCDIQGDALKLVQIVENMNFKQALDYCNSVTGGEPRNERGSSSWTRLDLSEI